MSAFANIENELQKMSDSFTKIQGEITQLQGEIRTVERLPLSPAEAEAELRKYISSQRTQNPGIDTLIDRISHGKEIDNFSNPFAANCFDNAGGAEAARARFIHADLAPVLCEFFEATLLEHLIPKVRAACEETGITEEDRQSKIKKLNSRLQKLEEQEESLADEAELNDFWGLVRRPGADPAIVLGVQG